MILEVADALELDKPVVMGCSIGGRIVLYLAHQHAKRFRAIIGLESAAHVAPYYDVEWLHRPDVHGGEVSAGVVSGLVAPTAPDNHRWETLWHYLQSGPGIFKGDLHFYKVDGDIRGKIDEIDGAALNALSAHRRIRLFLHHRGHARHRQAHRRAGDDHEGPRPFPDERGPAEVHRLSAAGAGRRFAVRRKLSAKSENAACPTPKPSTPCSPPRARPTRSSASPARLRYDALPEDARYYARRHLLDTVGVMIAGAPAAPSRRRPRTSSRRCAPAGKIPVPGRARRADLLDAAFLGGTAAHGIELDDGYRVGSAHCGCIVVPAALSVGYERARLSGRAADRGGRRRLRDQHLPRARLRAGPAPARLPSDQRGRPVRRRDGDRQAARAERAADRRRARHRGLERRRACSPSSTAAATSSGCTPATPRARACRRRCSPSRAPKARRT